MISERTPDIKNIPTIDFNQSPDVHLEALLSKYEEVSKTAPDIEIIKEAFQFMLKAHEGQVRKAGEQYYTHPLLTALYYMHIFNFSDVSSVVACLLHDAVEDSKDRTGKMQEVYDKFGDDIGDLVKKLTNIRGTTSDEASTFGKLLVAMISDFRVIMVKLCDRLHNMYTLESLSPKKQKIIARETLEFFVPAAQWIGKQNLKSVLEEQAFFYIDNDAFNFIKQEIKKKKMIFISDAYVGDLMKRIGEYLDYDGIKNKITIEHKNKYEIYRLIKGDISKIHKIDNFYSLVILIEKNDTAFCYFAMGVLLKFFKQINFKDYISYPKFNSFQSLLIHLLNSDGKKLEVLIRTKEMDDIATNGLLKTSKKNPFEKLDLTDEELIHLDNWIKAIVNNYKENATEKIWRMIKNNLFNEEIIVNVNNRDYRLPKDASLVDLAFLVDKEKAFYLSGAIIKNQNHNFSFQFKEKVEVELTYDDKPTIIRDWMNNAVLFKSIIEIDKYLKTYQQTVEIDKVR